jgi:DNA helicase-2/ATP-dependent DNA helicase PcrA
MDFLSQLNPAQREAVLALDGPVMIVAGAGSGKTRVLTYRIAHLIRSGVRPESVLALTFTNKAAGEMKGRIAALVGDAAARIWAGTFHSMFARMLRTECEHIGYERSFTIYDTDDSIAVAREVMQSLNITVQECSPQSMHARISAAKNRMVSPREYRTSASDHLAERAAAVYEQYERRLKRNNAFDFDDLLLKPLDLFSRRPDVLEKYQFRFRYLLVDEYQDTNRVQYLLMKRLAGRHGNICVVGDDAQSIYSFRGADIRNILDFEHDYPGCAVFRLEQNYRSTGTVLQAANSLIRHNRGQIEKKLWTENIEGEPVRVVRCTDDRDEAQRIVSIISEESFRDKRDLREFAVLYRTNAQSRSIEDALRRAGIPYSMIGGVAFYRRKEIKDVLAYLTIVANPQDDRSLLRIVNVPARGIGDVTIDRLSSIAAKEKTSLFTALGSEAVGAAFPRRMQTRLHDLARMIAKYISLRDSISLSELARSIVDETGLLQVLKEEHTTESLARRENIQELVSAISEFNDRNPDARLEDFLGEVSLVSDVDDADFSRNAVTLMTMHAAKGLEFPVVVLSGLEEGLFPFSSAMDSEQDLEEERRLMYVGMTRARQLLCITHCGTRYRFGELAYMVRSRFLDEIDPSCIQRQDAQTSRRIHARHVPVHTPVHSVRSRSHRDEQADAMPAYEDESQETVHPRVGLRVVHASFGEGTILALDGKGENARAIVDFASAGKKHLLLRFAHLKPA